MNLNNKIKELEEQIRSLNIQLAWTNEPLKDNETAKGFKSLLRRFLLEVVDTESEIDKIIKPYLTDFEMNGDSYGVPSLSDRVETAITKLAAKNKEFYSIIFPEATRIDKQNERAEKLEKLHAIDRQNKKIKK